MESSSESITQNPLPDWLGKFLDELKDIYHLVKGVSNYQHQIWDEETDVEYPVLTGSGAILFVLYYLVIKYGFEDMKIEISKFLTKCTRPRDLDFKYPGNSCNIKNPIQIGNFHIKSSQLSASSATFELQTSTSDALITSFDVIRINPGKKFFEIDGIRIVNLNTLKADYRDFDDDPSRAQKNDSYKIELIERIINKINTEHLIHEFGFDNYVSKPPRRFFRDLENQTPNLFSVCSFGGFDDEFEGFGISSNLSPVQNRKKLNFTMNNSKEFDALSPIPLSNKFDEFEGFGISSNTKKRPSPFHSPCPKKRLNFGKDDSNQIDKLDFTYETP